LKSFQDLPAVVSLFKPEVEENEIGVDLLDDR